MTPPAAASPGALRRVNAAQFRRAAGLGATVPLFMDHIRWRGDVLADDLFGQEIADDWMAVRSAQDAGHRLSLHSDGACSPTDPLSSIATSLTRRTHRSGRVHGTRERLTIDEALRAVTVNPARQLHLEHEIGMLRPGMCADVLDRV
ncbi:amidohydrolase family protein [Streptomyces sp. NPDC058486]|uniref:amidohydrolase family protein n=1 Tax=unclassified Streptomyces TaxID=2593676 RepID=UPI003664BB5C